MKNFFVIMLFSAQLVTIQAQWVNIGMLTGTGTQFPSVSAVNDSVVWIAGGSSGSPVIWRSTNSGTNFTSVNAPPCFELTCIYALSADECFVGDGGSSGYNGGNAKLYRTTDAGANWTLVNQTGGTDGFFLDVLFSKASPLDGIAVSRPPAGSNQPYFLLKTTDGGNNWIIQNPPPVAGSNGVWHCVIIYDAVNYGFSITGGILPRIYGTTTSGSTWQALPLLIFSSPVTAFDYSDINPVALAGTPSVVARSTDQGATWQTVNNGSALCIKWITGTNTCYFLSAAIIKKSTDEGAIWSSMTVPVSGLKHFDFAKSGNNVYGYGIAADGTVIKLTDVLTEIKPVNEIIPSRFKLEQNYPNPFNPSTKISFSLPNAGYTELSVFDGLGKEISVLVNEELEAGIYEVNWDGSDFPSGVYFYQLRVEDYIETKKMILMK